MQHTGREFQAFEGRDPEQVVDQTLMVRAGIGAGGHDPVDVHKQDGAGFCGNKIKEQFFSRNGGKGFRKDRSGIRMTEDMAVAPIEIGHRVDASGEDQADLIGWGPGSEDDLIFIIRGRSCVDANEQFFNMFDRDSMKQRRVTEKECIHKNSFNVVETTEMLEKE